MAGELGKASYTLDADLEPLRRNVKQSRAEVSDFERVLDNLTAITDIAAEALKQVKIDPRQANESRASASSIVDGVKGISDEARTAARELDRVRITDRQAAESDAAGDVIDRKLKDITGNANEARRSLESMRIAGLGAGGAGGPGGGGRNPGAGVGPFGSGFGRIGLLGAAVGAGVLTTPAAGPAVVGLLAAIPALSGAAAGSLGVLALAFDGVGKAIGGDKKAFDDLGPSAQAFVETVRSLDGWFDKLKETAAGSLFPGLTAGLKSALSPGTVAAFTTAISELGHALGMVGEQIGRYIGSSEFQSIFGPLMQSAARTVTNLAGAALSLFDAIGVLGRAAIPLTDWMTKGIAAGAQLADSWIHAKDATGQLGTAMNEAKTSLELVGRLLGALLNVLGALGSALYPVSKIAVKDLTDGLNALAGMIDRNKQTIRDIVSGALSALVSTVKILIPIISTLAGMLNAVVNAVGGWKVAFELVLGGFLALKFVSLAGAVGGFVSKLTEARLGMLALGAPEVLAALAAAAGAWLLLTGNKQDSFNGSFPSGSTDVSSITGQRLKVAQQVLALQQQGKTTAQIQDALRGKVDQYQVAQAFTDARILKTGGGTSSAYFSQQDVLGLLLRNGVPANVAQNLARVSAKGEDPSGDPTRINNNPSTGDYSVGLFQENFFNKLGPGRVKQYAPQFGLSPTMSVTAFTKWLGEHPDAQAKIAYQIYQSQGYKAWTTAKGLGITDATSTSTTSGAGSPFGSDPAFTKNLGPKPSVVPAAVTAMLNAASANASKALQLGDKGGTAKRYLENEIADLDAAKKGLEAKLVGASGKNKTQLETALTGVENKIRSAQTLIKNSLLETGNALLPASLKSQLMALQTKFKADSTFASALTGQAAEAYQSVLLGDIRGQEKTLTSMVSVLTARLASSTGRQKKATADELAKITTELQSVQEQVVQTLQGTVQTLQQKVSASFQNVQRQLDTAFEAATQKMIDAAGAQFFQNGLQTPLEAELASMQAQDQLQQLQDAVSQAATPEAKAAAQRQLDEYDLGIRAAKERTDADQAYAVEVRRIQTERSALENAMNAQLATLSDGFANGTASISDLNDLATQYGITLDTVTIPDLDNLTTATSQLKDAFKALADYIAQITGTRPTIPGDDPPTSPAAGVIGAIPRAIAGHAIPMADGGIGTVRMPTLFLAGEKGVEDFAFSGGGRSFNSMTRRAAPAGDIVLEVDGRELARANADGLSRNRHAVRLTAKAVKPALDRVVTVG